jgi:CheY-like chemotaxis protein/ribosomal protein L37AE/L43A
MRDEDFPDCPYCGRSLRYVANRWFGHNVFECEQCGDFPDFRGGAAAPLEHQATVLSAALKPVVRSALPRVLLVDDSDEQRTFYATLLQPSAVVMTASRGEDALALACADPPDVIILDVMMPGMNGWETCERLKGEPITANIPIVMLTSLDGVDVPARARQAGANAVLMKPCPEERLLLTISATRRSADPRSATHRN